MKKIILEIKAVYQRVCEGKVTMRICETKRNIKKVRRIMKSNHTLSIVENYFRSFLSAWSDYINKQKIQISPCYYSNKQKPNKFFRCLLNKLLSAFVRLCLLNASSGIYTF